MNSTNKFFVAFFLGLQLSLQANATDSGFRFNPSRVGKYLSVCTNSEGRVGYNFGEWIECGSPKSTPDGLIKYFSNIKVPNQNLINLDLDDVTLDSGDFSGSDLSYALAGLAIIKKVNFTGAKMNGLNTPSGIFDNCNFTGVSFKGMIAPSAQITNSNLRGANFESAVLLSMTFTYNDLRGANFYNADFGARYSDDIVTARENDMRGANFSNLKSWPVVFYGNDVRDTDLSSLPDYVQLNGSIFNDGTKLPFSREIAEKRGMIYHQ